MEECQGGSLIMQVPLFWSLKPAKSILTLASQGDRLMEKGEWRCRYTIRWGLFKIDAHACQVTPLDNGHMTITSYPSCVQFMFSEYRFITNADFYVLV